MSHVAIWPDELPYPQVGSLRFGGPAYCEVTDVLAGPARTRMKRRNSGGTWEWEVWLSGAQAEFFEEWYDDVIEEDHGEFYLPWIGAGRVVIFPDEYVLEPIGRSWRLRALVVQTRVDPTICDEHVCESFSGLVLIDDGVSADTVTGDLAADLIIIAGNTFVDCGLIKDNASTTDQVTDDGVSEDIISNDFPLAEYVPC